MYKLEIISTKEWKNLWQSQRCEFDADVGILLCSHCAGCPRMLGKHFYPWVVFHSEVHPPAGPVNMSTEPWGLRSVVFCCTEMKQKTHETLQNITFWQKSGNSVRALLQNRSSTSRLTVWPRVCILLMGSRSKTSRRNFKPTAALRVLFVAVVFGQLGRPEAVLQWGTS